MAKRYHVEYNFGEQKIVQAFKAGFNTYNDEVIESGRKNNTLKECRLERCEICARNNLTPEPYYNVGEYILRTYGSYSNYDIGKLFLVNKRFAPENIEQAILDGYVTELPYKENWDRS